MFANKQIVCIEYMEISEDDEREIFRVRCDPCSTLSQSFTPLYSPACTTWDGSQLCGEDEGRGPDTATDARTRASQRIRDAPPHSRI